MPNKIEIFKFFCLHSLKQWVPQPSFFIRIKSSTNFAIKLISYFNSIQYDPELEQKLKQSAAPTQPEYRDPNRINQPPSVSTTNGQV